MLKKRIVNWVIAMALLAAVVGGSGVVADSFGLPTTPQAYACASSGGSGGGC